ncbi:MAG: ParB/RepB/Spo0J family partition protein [Fusobacteriaceae bacterium]|nr:ParB/RepB/Spo0J family partition protein [Fusobacteriaceae bacterium]
MKRKSNASKNLLELIKNQEDIPEIRIIDLEDVYIKKNVRIDYEDENLNSLAKSIEKHGLQSPIKVLKKENKFEIVYGHRRYLAYEKLKKKDSEKFAKIACVIDTSANIKDDTEIMSVQLVENIEREDLSTYEKGKSLSEYKNITKKTNGDIASEFNRKEKWVRDLISAYEILESIESILDEKEKAKFRNLPFSIINSIKGLDPEESKKLLEMYMTDNLKRSELVKIRTDKKNNVDTKEKTKVKKEPESNNEFIRFKIDRKEYNLKKKSIEKVNDILKYIDENVSDDEDFKEMIKYIFGKFNK